MTNIRNVLCVCIYGYTVPRCPSYYVYIWHRGYSPYFIDWRGLPLGIVPVIEVHVKWDYRDVRVNGLSYGSGGSWKSLYIAVHLTILKDRRGNNF